MSESTCNPPPEEKTSDIKDEAKASCTLEEFDLLFKHKYKIHDEIHVSPTDDYVLSLAKDDSFTCIAAGLSNGSVRVFDVNSQNGVYVEPPIADCVNICGVRFMNETPNLLLVGTTNGLVRLLDLRTRNEVTRFINKLPDEMTPIHTLSFDRNSNSCLLAMGSAQHGDRVTISFYDMRTSKTIFVYKDSHEDDVTSLCFHPENPNLLSSGSTDCLINVFDVRENDDYNAILRTINTYTTVHKVHWHTNKFGANMVSCITHINSFKSYTFDGDVIADFDRLKICDTINESKEDCCLINSHNMADKSIMLLSASHLGNGSTVRACNINNDKLLPYATFIDNKQIVRDSVYDTKTNILITAGESNIVTLWTPLEWSTPTTSSSSLKMKTKKLNTVTPY